jgi:hypothetical protein
MITPLKGTLDIYGIIDHQVKNWSYFIPGTGD